MNINQTSFIFKLQIFRGVATVPSGLSNEFADFVELYRKFPAVQRQPLTSINSLKKYLNKEFSVRFVFFRVRFLSHKVIIIMYTKNI